MDKVGLKLLHLISSHTKAKQQCQAKRLYITSKNTQQDAGFTLLEMIVIVVIVGVLSAIAAPGWLAFTQRQRVNKANDVVLAALQEAQRQAKKTKLSYSVSFTTDSSKGPQIAIHPSTSTPNSYWRNLGGDVGVKPRELVLGTNISAKNTVSTLSYAGTYTEENQQTISFDYLGTLAPKSDETAPNDGLKVVVAEPKFGSPSEAGNVKRCVIVQTLIGGIRTAKDEDCD